jgi:hypothetical protein
MDEMFLHHKRCTAYMAVLYCIVLYWPHSDYTLTAHVHAAERTLTAVTTVAHIPLCTVSTEPSIDYTPARYTAKRAA